MWRDRKPSKRYAWKFFHTPLSLEELKQYEDVLEGELLIVGTGFEGKMVVMDEVKSYLKDKGIELIEMRTPQAVALYDYYLMKGVKASVILHLTC
ncbi:hypothetical protein IPA_04125 [Ignicoccus pacificus DSM 13166]|uniref:Uncharacterized protein n=1 Tax=Ignicoccus pacificus DSM 13166 TaxID=940294 RepID=A0A977PKU3_9CREN|nr:hypothetical protein IPA_04125 [Ignicoccus pacificus DSM 13166]